MTGILKKLICLLVFALALSCPALAIELSPEVLAMLPEGTVMDKTEVMGSLHLHTASVPDTGEVILLVCSNEKLIVVETQQAADHDPTAPAVTRSRAEELVKQAWQDSRILFSKDVEEGKLLGVAGNNFCGSVLVADDRLISRSLEVGEIYRDGRLTMDGALKVLTLHRPEAEFYALELDREDGVFIYEGEALIDGVEYEFELDVSSGRLLEWERD